MTTVAELVPGDIVTAAMPGLHQATFVAKPVHPLFPGMRLVVWWVHDDGPGEREGWWSHDALDPRQYVGEVVPATPEDRIKALRRALLHRSQW